MTLPTDSKARKDLPIATGVFDYFPAALAAVAAVSREGNEKHNPGQPLHWSREKSSDHADCIARHLFERGGIDTDGTLHSAKLAWRALALLQEELEDTGMAALSRGSHVGTTAEDDPLYNPETGRRAGDPPDTETGWVEWDGVGTPPIEPFATVEVELSHGYRAEAEASSWDWSGASSAPIVRYRVVPK